MTRNAKAIARTAAGAGGLRAALLALGLATAVTIAGLASLALGQETTHGEVGAAEEDASAFGAMRETMRRAREATDPAERRALMAEHMRMMGDRMGAMRGGHQAGRGHGKATGGAEEAEAPDMMEMMARHHAHMEGMMAMMERHMAMAPDGCGMMRGHGMGGNAMGQHGATGGGMGHGGMMGGGLSSRGPESMSAEGRLDSMEQMMEQMLAQQRMMMEMMRFEE